MLKSDYFIEKKSFEGYSNLIAKISDRKLADLVSVNSLEAHLMELWLQERIEMLETTRSTEIKDHKPTSTKPLG